MIKREYSILPIEPTFFVRSIDVSIGNQIPNINPVDTNFASLFVDKTSVPLPILTYLDQPIKTTTDRKADIFVYTFEKPSDLLVRINGDTYNTIELKGAPSFIKKYSEYEGYILDFISKIVSKNIYLNCVYVPNIIQNIKKYNIKGISVEQYGFCTKAKPEITDLFNYYINIDVLTANTAALSPAELVIQTDLICTPLKEITNTFASQLWLYDFLFQLASANVKKTFIDMASFNNIYSVMAFSYATRSSPVFYSSKISYGSLTKPNIPIYIMKNINEYIISVIHKDITEENVQINISFPSYTPGQLVRYLCNQTILGEYGITFGELTFDGSTSIPNNARTRAPSTHVESSVVAQKDGKYTFVMDKMSIAILRIPISSAGAYFENINPSDEGSTVVTINPDPRDYSSPTTMSVKRFQQDFQQDL